MEGEVAQWLAKDRKGYWAYEPNEANRANIQEKNKFGFNNTELINLVLIMFPAGIH